MVRSFRFRYPITMTVRKSWLLFSGPKEHALLYLKFVIMRQLSQYASMCALTNLYGRPNLSFNKATDWM